MKIETLLERKDYAALERELSRSGFEELAEDWGGLRALDKLIVFKLLDAPRALQLYGMLPYKEKYHLLCGFPLQSIAPVLEGMGPLERRRFVQLPRESYDAMFRQLVTERVEITISPGLN